MPFHALTGSDKTGQFADIWKQTFWKILAKHPELLKDLGKDKYPSDLVISNAEPFVCKLYNPVRELKCIQKLISLLFRKAKKCFATSYSENKFSVTHLENGFIPAHRCQI